MKWPMGDRLTVQVARLQGWANVFVGAASLVLAILLLVLPTLLVTPALPVRWIVGIILTVVVGLLLCGVVPYVQSVRLSRA